MKPFRRFAAAALVALAACSDSTGPPPAAPRVAATISPVSTAGLVGPAAGPLPDSVAVVVHDSAGAPVPGVVVGFAVTRGGGSVSPASAKTDAQGVARTQWVLGPDVSATQTLYAEARAGVATVVGATALVTASASLTKVSGDGQTVPTLTRVTLVVELRQNGVPIQGAAVRLKKVPDDAPSVVWVSTTDAQGRASFLATLGTPGVVSLVASPVSLDAPAVTFTTNVTTGPAAALLFFSSTNATLSVGTVQRVSILVRDAGQNPVPGAQVQVAVTGGTAPSVVTSDASGFAVFNWTLPTSVAVPSQTLTVTSGAATNTSHVSLTPGPAASVVIEPASVTVAAGQEAFFGAALYDAYGNRVVNRNPECTVVWTVPAPATTFTPPKYVTTIYVRSQVSVPVTVTCGAASNTAQYIVS